MSILFTLLPQRATLNTSQFLVTMVEQEQAHGQELNMLDYHGNSGSQRPIKLLYSTTFAEELSCKLMDKYAQDVML